MRYTPLSRLTPIGVLLALSLAATPALASRSVPVEDAQTLYQQGITQLEQGNIQAALDALTRAVEADPEFAYAHCERGYALATLGDLEAAVEEFRITTELDAAHADAFNRWGIALASLGNVE